MSDPYLVDLQPGDPPEIRRLVIQRWFHQVAQAFATTRGGTIASGGYKIDITPGDDKIIAGCADVAWAKEASVQA